LSASSFSLSRWTNRTRANTQFGRTRDAHCVASVSAAVVGYAATLLWIVKRGTLAGVRHRLAAVGMALSNYLFHSVIASVLFLGWGLGLAGRFDTRRSCSPLSRSGSCS